ncbi:hypothetical protein EZV73_12725 [Acidaminobacter sp. JC074]|uniref:hypothetical protein n=1 Tax=Acidaminobacter sp. JC074 TaxID=2530199 RepID=UPI001F117872|nr:hypothetical protein [Acidaminobacter sp. JC074]MCH4888448.1 hypothetical protein [Acidaminobacter sp. JC074]
MKWMISVLIVVLLMPVKVVYIESDGVDMLTLNRPKEIILKQYHSVSLTNIESVLLADKDGIYIKSVSFKDQAGAGMPNPNIMVHTNKFEGSVDQKLDLPVRFIEGSSNALESPNLKVDFDGGGSLDIKRTSILLILLDRMGVI